MKFKKISIHLLFILTALLIGLMTVTASGDDKKVKKIQDKEVQSEQIIKSADSTLVRIKNMSAKLDSLMAEMDKQKNK